MNKVNYENEIKNAIAHNETLQSHNETLQSDNDRLHRDIEVLLHYLAQKIAHSEQVDRSIVDIHKYFDRRNKVVTEILEVLNNAKINSTVKSKLIELVQQL